MTLKSLRDYKHNLLVNLLDGAFFGFALGFASFSTVLPLFVSTLTDSAILIGLIPAIHSVGWQFPQLLIADRVSRQRIFKPMMLFLTVHERLPFIGLALVAYLIPSLGRQAALFLTFLLLIWQGLGSGFAATPWQSMIAKIFPPERRGTFYGSQSAAANLFSSLAAVLAGFILAKLPFPQDFIACFILASLSMGVSWFFLAQTREADNEPVLVGSGSRNFWTSITRILKQDVNFRWFLAARMLLQIGTMATAFYTVYAVRRLGMSEITVGFLTALLLGVQIVAAPVMGWLGDHWSHRLVMIFGSFASASSALLAWLAPSPAWFYLVFLLAGIANVAVWAIGLAMILEFGTDAERPAYIGLANTLVAPSTILAPLLGGWLVEIADFPAAFIVSALGAVSTIIVLQWMVIDPRKMRQSQPEVQPLQAGEGGP